MYAHAIGRRAIMGGETPKCEMSRCRGAPVVAPFWPSRLSLTFTFTASGHLGCLSHSHSQLLAILGVSLAPGRAHIHIHNGAGERAPQYDASQMACRWLADDA